MQDSDASDFFLFLNSEGLPLLTSEVIEWKRFISHVGPKTLGISEFRKLNEQAH